MASLGLIGRAASGLFAGSGIAYVFFALSSLNPKTTSWLWNSVVYASPEVIVAWVVFALCGIAAYAYRLRFESRPLAVTGVLVGLPLLWIIGVMLLYTVHGDGLWPVSFLDEDWRWFAAITYAQFAFAMMIGSGGLAAFALHPRRSRHSQSR